MGSSLQNRLALSRKFGRDLDCPISDKFRIAKTPVSTQDRIIELLREIGRLQQEIKYKTLVNEVLHPVMTVVRFHTNGLNCALREFNVKIERANCQWKAEKVE